MYSLLSYQTNEKLVFYCCKNIMLSICWIENSMIRKSNECFSQCAQFSFWNVFWMVVSTHSLRSKQTCFVSVSFFYFCNPNSMQIRCKYGKQFAREKKSGFSEQINNVNERELKYVSVFEWQVHFQHNLKFCLFYCVLNERKKNEEKKMEKKAPSIIIIIVVAVVLNLCSRTHTYTQYTHIQFFWWKKNEFSNFKFFVVILPPLVLQCCYITFGSFL